MRFGKDSVLGFGDAAFSLYDRSFHAVFIVEIHRDYRKLSACLSQDSETGHPVVCLRDDCTRQFAWLGQPTSLFVFQYVAVYCCRLFYCCGYSVALPVQVAGRDNVAAPSRLLDSDDVLGDFTPAGNFAEQVDRCVLGRFRDGVFWNEDGSWSFSPSYNYTWIWSSLTFGVTVMLGAFAGKIMKEGKANRRKVVQTLLVVGLVLVGLALLWSLQMPVIKRIWTGSMTLLSGGYCFLLMALFYYWIDYKGHTRGLEWLKVYGMNSITAYLLGEVVNFRCVAASVSYGLEQYLGGYYSVWLTFANYLIVFFLLKVMYKHGLFLKV